MNIINVANYIFLNTTPPVLKALRTFYVIENILEKTHKKGGLKVRLKNDQLKLGRVFYGNFDDSVMDNLNLPSLKENFA